MISFKLGKEIEEEIFLCSTLVTRRKTSFSISLPSLKLTISLVLCTKHDAIDIADPSSNETCSPESLWLNGKASELGIRRSDVRFLMETPHNFFLCPTLVTRRKNIFLSSHHSFLFGHWEICNDSLLNNRTSPSTILGHPF